MRTACMLVFKLLRAIFSFFAPLVTRCTYGVKFGVEGQFLHVKFHPICAEETKFNCISEYKRSIGGISLAWFLWSFYGLWAVPPWVNLFHFFLLPFFSLSFPPLLFPLLTSPPIPSPVFLSLCPLSFPAFPIHPSRPQNLKFGICGHPAAPQLGCRCLQFLVHIVLHWYVMLFHLRCCSWGINTAQTEPGISSK